MKILTLIVVSLMSFSALPKGAKKPPSPAKGRGFINKKYSPCVNDLEKKFSRMRKYPKKVHKYKVNSRVFYRYGYRSHLFNKNTMGIENHFQGLVKLGGSNNFLFSGGDWKRKESHLFVINRGRVTKKILLERGKKWHPGGMQKAGDILPIFIETYKMSPKVGEIWFFDVRDPKNPKLLPLKISAGGTAAIGIFRRRTDGKYILNMGYRVAISKTSNILDGFESPRTFHGAHPGQGQSLIQDCKTKQMYLMTFTAKGRFIPFITSAEVATLYKFYLKEGESRPSASKIKEKHFKCGFLNCSFSGGVTLAVDRGNLKIYSLYHYRRYFGNRVFIGEFR